jgi:hypothetical protein
VHVISLEAIAKERGKGNIGIIRLVTPTEPIMQITGLRVSSKPVHDAMLWRL